MTNKIIYMVLIYFIGACLCSNSTYSQQVTFGVTGGLLNGAAKEKGEDYSISASDTGFYVGVFSRMPLSEKLGVIAELDYGNFSGNSLALVSVRGQYYVIEKFYLQVGPQLSYLIGLKPDEINRLGIDLNLGLGYDITNQFSLQARYSLEVTNRLKEASSGETAGINWLQVGIGYSF